MGSTTFCVFFTTLTLSGAPGAYCIPSGNNSFASVNISTNTEYGGYDNPLTYGVLERLRVAFLSPITALLLNFLRNCRRCDVDIL